MKSIRSYSPTIKTRWSLTKRWSSTRTASKTSTGSTRWTTTATLTMASTISSSINHHLKMKRRKNSRRSLIDIICWISRIRGRRTKMCRCLTRLAQMNIMMKAMRWALMSKTPWSIQWMEETTTISSRNFHLRHLWYHKSRTTGVKMSWKESLDNSSSSLNQMNYNNYRV